MADTETLEMLQSMDLLYEYYRGSVVISDHAASDRYKRWIDVKVHGLVGYVLCPYCKDDTYWRCPDDRCIVNARKRCPKCGKRVYASEDWMNVNVPPQRTEDVNKK